MRGEWAYWEPQFTPDECDQIVALADRLNPHEALAGGRVNPEVRKTSQVKFLAHSGETEWLFSRLWRLAVRTNAEWFRVNVDTLPSLQIACYEVGDYYNDHIDAFFAKPDSHRKLSVVVQLSDPGSYEGGDLELITEQAQPDRDAIREQGAVIFFPSLIRHRVTAVTKGERRSLVAWFEGPHWS